jgi:hypothetical protein
MKTIESELTPEAMEALAELSPIARQYFLECIATKGKNRGRLKKLPPKSNPLAYAAYQGVILKWNPFKASIIARICFSEEQSKIERELSQWAENHMEFGSLSRSLLARTQGRLVMDIIVRNTQKAFYASERMRRYAFELRNCAAGKNSAEYKRLEKLYLRALNDFDVAQDKITFPWERAKQ